MSRDTLYTPNATPPSGAGERDGVTALVISGRNDSWLVPDAPFLDAGCRVVRASGSEDALAKCAMYQPKLVFLPLSLDGHDIRTQIDAHLSAPAAPVIVVIASNDQINAAAEAMRAGAFDCLFRPFSNTRLVKTIENALRQLPPEPKSTMPAPFPLESPDPAPGQRGALPASATPGLAVADSLLGVSPEMHAVLARAQVIAESDAPVFISGEIGTGKSQLARHIHDLSPRASAPWAPIDCAAFCPQQLEEEILGPDGTGGKLQGGTLFLDEICELPVDAQSRLLRLTERSGPSGRRVDLRIIAATRHDPREAIRQGRLRADLFYRVHVAPIALPPLRARPGDVALIARTKLSEYAEAEGHQFTGFSDAALALLEAYPWPGNVRELLNVVWTVALLNSGPVVIPAHLPEEIRAGKPVTEDAQPPEPSGPSTRTRSLEEHIDGLTGFTLAEIEQAVIEATIRAEGGSIPRAARVLDVSPSTIYRKREAWGRNGSG